MFRALFFVVGLTSFASAGEPVVLRDVPYAEPKNERQTLDVFAPADARHAPIVFWIHGGGWRRGDKAGVQGKPRAFNDRGCVFVATNYRFVPTVKLDDMLGDIARAIAWTHRHAGEFGGDPRRIVVMGHSAGAHLAALVCTDERYLKHEGLTLDVLRGCVPIDVSAYDIAKRFEDTAIPPPAAFAEVFGTTAEEHRRWSPITYVAADKHIPAFCILHVADRPETKVQSHHFAERLNAAGIAAEVVAGEGKTHGTINSELGLPDDKPTQAVDAFLDRVLSKK